MTTELYTPPVLDWPGYLKAPVVWYGGKHHASPYVWSALGDVSHYVEPFFGSGAVLLDRPHLANRPYASETVNDFDGLLVNLWRAIAADPDAVADAASWPVSELDLTARHLALVRWRSECQRMHLAGDPHWYDAAMAGWYAWGCACWIGGGWCAGDGPWTADENGFLYKQGKGKPRDAGVWAGRPHIHDQGQGVNAPQMRAPGVNAKLPHLNKNGQGVNHQNTREPGVKAQRPHIHDNGQGVSHGNMREPDVWDDDAQAYHAMTMPRLRNWLRWLSARMRHVRILSGDWARALTPSASLTLSCRQGKGVCGVFLDPPYADTAGRADNLYAHDDLQVAHRVRDWCLRHTEHPSYRIVLAGFEGEHGTSLTDAGWREIEWFAAGHLRGGYSNGSERGHQQARERLWLSPQCLTEAVPAAAAQLGLCWDDEEEE